MSECAGLTGEEIEFLGYLRRMEEMWRRGFDGSMTLHIAKDGALKFEFRAFGGEWQPGDDRRFKDRRDPPRGEDRRKLG